MYRVICDETNNTPETIERNELRATIILTPYRWADDESYLAWHDPAVRPTKKWVMNGDGAVELDRSGP